MAKPARYLWGKTKVDRVQIQEYIDLKAQDSAPDAVAGRIYMSSDYTLHKCLDGTSWATLLDLVATSNPPVLAAGRVWVDATYKIRISENGTTWVTVTTG